MGIGVVMKIIDYGELIEMQKTQNVRHIDASCSVLLLLYDRRARNLALYKRISGAAADIKFTGNKFNFLDKNSEIIVLAQDYNRFSIAIADKNNAGTVQYHLIGKKGEQQGVSAVLLYNRNKKPKFHLRGVVEDDSANRICAFARKFERDDDCYLNEFLEPLLAALPERFDLELFINQALGHTDSYVREMRKIYD